jgi:hypothetical protein
LCTFGRATLQDRQARLVVRHVDVDNQSAVEPDQEAVVELLDLPRRPVARQHDLLVFRLQLLDDPQQLRLHLPPVRQEVHVV